MWYRIIFVITIVTLVMFSAGNYTHASNAKSKLVVCPSGIVNQVVYEDGYFWMYVYCDGSLVDKYIIVE